MVGLVIVSHSATLARGVVELARQMGAEVPIEAAGGMAEPEGEIGTDVGLVTAALERAAAEGGDDGVLVLMDLGSAVMSAEMAAEMFDGPRVLLCEAPLVEGAVAAAARAGAGADLDEVAAEARAALTMKTAQLTPDEPPAAEKGSGTAVPDPFSQSVRLEVPNRLGLHARPAARFVATAGGFDAQIAVHDETTGRGPADARSLSALVTLAIRQGHTIRLDASGPQAAEALAALQELATTGFGDALTGSDPVYVEKGSGTAVPDPFSGRLQGVPAASGIVIAPARLGSAAEVEVDETPAGDAAHEWARLEAAIAAARRDVEAARDAIAGAAGADEAAIFDAHLLMLQDSALLDPARAAIDAGTAAGPAWRDAAAASAQSLRALDDPYLRERAADVEDVAGRVLRHLAGTGAEAGGIRAPGILVVRDLLPGDAATLDRDLVQGLAVARGGATSHAAILARALGIPSVVGLGEPLLAVAEGTPLVLDGDAGTLELDPPDDVVAERERARDAATERRAAARSLAHERATTRDGETIEVAANIGSLEDARAAVEAGADGVGLLRTEFLFLDRDEAPTEEEQREILAEIAAALQGRPLIVRTLDAGADKPLRYLPQPQEDNPFLGLRGIRLGLANPDLLRTQLRAIAAVAKEHPLRVMFPMVATLDELRAARAMLDAVRAELDVPPFEVGVMVEVPAVALAAPAFAREVDFFSVGSNDLTQYTLAAERGNEQLAKLLAGPVPAVLRLVQAVAATGRWTGVCGELGGDPAAAILLAGLGVRELSMAAPRVAEVKQALRGVTLADARAAASLALEAEDAAAAAALAGPLLRIL